MNDNSYYITTSYIPCKVVILIPITTSLNSQMRAFPTVESWKKNKGTSKIATAFKRTKIGAYNLAAMAPCLRLHSYVCVCVCVRERERERAWCRGAGVREREVCKIKIIGKQ
jgi:hypothetical protein